MGGGAQVERIRALLNQINNSMATIAQVEADILAVDQEMLQLLQGD